jgi:hypothetical protein
MIKKGSAVTALPLVFGGFAVVALRGEPFAAGVGARAPGGGAFDHTVFFFDAKTARVMAILDAILQRPVFGLLYTGHFITSLFAIDCGLLAVRLLPNASIGWLWYQSCRFICPFQPGAAGVRCQPKN